MINEITDPIPREHAACIVRAGALMKRIIKLRDSQEMMILGGIDNAMSTITSVEWSPLHGIHRHHT